jgi:uncharacterized protein (DUF697 family)/uncharacterized tellurite resistance protein B-like protein
MNLSDSERHALLTLCAMAAYADGENHELEREELKRILDGLQGSGINPVSIYQAALKKPLPLAETVANLQSKEARALAYEMAVCVCDADRELNNAEREFLKTLREHLQLPAASAAEFEQQTAEMAFAPVNKDIPVATAVVPPPVMPATNPADAEADKMILNYAILNGAVELLPQSMATMAIIPLQMKMVYRVGKLYGVELDRGHIVEFLTAAGVGMTSQVVEGYARKMFGGLIGKYAGKSFGKIGKGMAEQATSSAFSFASTYALGQVAKSYYANGRRLSTNQLRDQFQSLRSQAEGLHSRYAGEIQQQSRSLNLSSLLPNLKNSGMFRW